MFTKVKQPEFLSTHQTLSSHQECIVQINLPHSSEQKFISINNMQRALDNDPDLASIPRENVFLTFQLLSIVPYPREKPPMGGTPYIGFRPGGGPTFAVSLSHLSAERAPR